MTGMRMAHTRGGKKFWSGWSSSTKGWACVSCGQAQCFRGRGRGTDHQECPDGVVEEDGGGDHQHGEADEFVELVWG